MRTHTPDSQSWPQILLFVLYFSTHISPAWSIPRSLSPRQTIFDNLKLPPCALTCFVNEVQKDGCENQTDFACHCGSGDIMRKTAKCMKQKCNPVEEADATRKVQLACGGLGMDESNAVTSTAPVLSTQSKSGFKAPASSQLAIPSGNNGVSTITPSSPPTSGPSSLPYASSMPTNAPLGPEPSSPHLSPSLPPRQNWHSGQLVPCRPCHPPCPRLVHSSPQTRSQNRASAYRYYPRNERRSYPLAQ
jgi:hypothetical protein